MSKERLADNRSGSTTTYHDSDGNFTSKDKARSVSYGHYENDGGKLQITKSKNGKPQPRIPKHQGGSQRTKKGSGGRGHYKYRLKDKTPKWEHTINEDWDAERVGMELKASLTKIQRLEVALAKERHRAEWLQAQASTLQEEIKDDVDKKEDDLSSVDGWKRSLKLAGLSMEQISKVLDGELENER